MNELEEQIYDYVAAATEPVTIVHINNKFGGGIERIYGIQHMEDKDQRYLIAWDMSEDVVRALDALLTTDRLELVPCDERLFYDMGITEDDLVRPCTIETVYDEELQDYLPVIVPWAPLQFITNKKQPEETQCKYKIVSPDDPMYDEFFEDV